MGVLDLVAWGENFLDSNSTDLQMHVHDKYRYILDEDPHLF